MLRLKTLSLRRADSRTRMFCSLRCVRLWRYTARSEGHFGTGEFAGPALRCILHTISSRRRVDKRVNSGSFDVGSGIVPLTTLVAFSLVLLKLRG